jgi:hypothetical protein
MKNTNKCKYADVYGFEDNYQVSSNGDIISKKTGKTLAPQIVRKYNYVSMQKTKDGITTRKNARVCRVVLKSFTKVEGNSLQVNHKNLDNLDDRLENLEWCTRSENQLHSYKYGNRMPGGKIKHNIQFVKNMFKLRQSGMMIKDIAKLLSIPKSTITHILLGTRRTLKR